MQLILVQNEEMVKAFAADAAEEAFADGVRAGCPDGRPQHLDAAPGRDARELCAEFAVIVADQEARSRAEGRRLAQLLGNPGIGRMPRDADVDDFAGAKVDDEKSEERAEPQVDDRQEIACPHVTGMMMQEGRARLAAWPSWPRRAHVPLHRALGDPAPEFQEFAACLTSIRIAGDDNKSFCGSVVVALD